jgi:SPW repeat
MWARLLSAALGAWLMAAADVLDYGGIAGVSDHVVGPIVVGASVVAAWPVMRPLRWVGLVAGVWLLVAPWILGYHAMVAMENTSVVGFLLAAIALLGGEEGSRFGGGWGSLLRRKSGAD